MLAAVLAHLKDNLPDSRWHGFEIAEDIDTLAEMAGRVRDSTAIVMPWRERAGEQSLATGGFQQRIEVQFVAGVVLREHDQFMGEDRALRFDALKRDLEAALAGWEPPDFIEPCELVGGETSPISRGVSIYVQTWATARFLTGE